MAFKFPRPLFPFGGGARSVDRDTVIVDDGGISTRFGDTIAAAPGRPAGSPPARRRITLPLLDRLPKRGQLAVLFPVLGLSLLLAFVFMWLDSRQSGAVAIQTRLVGDSLMHSQRLAKAAPMAVRGGGDAFRQLAESRGRLSEAVAALQSGGMVREQRVEPVDGALQPALARLAEPWKRTDQAAATLAQLQPTLSSIAQAARTVLDAQPRIVEFAEQVTALKAAVPAPAPEIAAAAQPASLSHFTIRSATAFSSPEPPGIAMRSSTTRRAAAGSGRAAARWGAAAFGFAADVFADEGRGFAGFFMRMISRGGWRPRRARPM